MAGPGVVVTRDEGVDGPLTRLLRGRGLTALHWPTIRLAPPADPAPLEAALERLSDFDWAVFTSRRAVAAVVGRAAPGPSLRVAAVGESTADALTEAGWPVHLVPEPHTGEALVTALIDAGAGDGTRVLFPASAIARDVVRQGLEEAGASVTQVVAYATEAAPLDAAACRHTMETGGVAVITFTSPSTVANLAAALGAALAAALECPAAAIGPTTGAAAREVGFDVVEAETQSLEGLAETAAMLAVRSSIEEA